MRAARADFPLDRLADAVLVSDAIAAHAEEYMVGGEVGLAIEDGDGSLDFRVGPLREGGAKGLLSELEVPGFGGSLERLVNGVDIEEPGETGDEFLVLTIQNS
jgi:serine/threonine-protein kinase RsbW